MTGHLSPAAARRVFWTLSVTRWLPVGLMVGLLTLWQLERGQTVAAALTAAAASGFVVFFLELPTSSFADVFGRRPVYLAAAVVNVGAAAVYLVADSFWMFAVAAALMGLFRALDSGPLEAWYVDTVHLSEPGADVDGALSVSSMLLGASMAVGSLLAGVLVWWHPYGGASALWLPMALFLVGNVVHLVASFVLMREPVPQIDATRVARAVESAKQAPAVVRSGLGLLRTSTVLAGLVVVEFFWSTTMVVFEQFMPIRLGEMLGSEAEAGAWMGPVAAAGWAVFAAGAALGGWYARRHGVARTAIYARILNSLGAIVMGVVAGPVALVVAYFFTYSMHGSGGPMHSALLHREASAGNRATVLSMNSMVAFGTFAVMGPLLGLLATSVSTPVAMVTAATIGLAGAFWYLPALRHERELPKRQAVEIPG